MQLPVYVLGSDKPDQDSHRVEAYCDRQRTTDGCRPRFGKRQAGAKRNCLEAQVSAVVGQSPDSRQTMADSSPWLGRRSRTRRPVRFSGGGSSSTKESLALLFDKLPWLAHERRASTRVGSPAKPASGRRDHGNFRGVADDEMSKRLERSVAAIRTGSSKKLRIGDFPIFCNRDARFARQQSQRTFSPLGRYRRNDRDGRLFPAEGNRNRFTSAHRVQRF